MTKFLIHYLRKTYRNINYCTKNFLRNNSEEPNYLTSITTLVNSKNFTSNTSYFIYLDTKNFKTNIFQGSKNNWKLIHSYLCSIGKPSTPN